MYVSRLFISLWLALGGWIPGRQGGKCATKLIVDRDKQCGSRTPMESTSCELVLLERRKWLLHPETRWWKGRGQAKEMLELLPLEVTGATAAQGSEACCYLW